MNGAESLVKTLVASGVEVCFTNPGTSEMHFVAALDKVDGMRAILGLFEGVVTGAADGYGRMAEKPAATLLHTGPGLANGLANLHNARRASTPIVNIVGDHATYHAQYDAPLESDIKGFADPVSGWIHSSTNAKTVASDGARAVAASMEGEGQIATLILPADTAWLEADQAAAPLDSVGLSAVNGEAIDRVAKLLANGKKTAILIRGTALKEEGLREAGRIAAKSGARLMCDTFTPRIQRGAGRVLVDRLPYFAEQAEDDLKGTEQLILVGAKPPVSFFAYPDKASWLSPKDCDITYLAHPHEDGTAALAALAEAIGAPAEPINVAPYEKPDMPTGPLDQFTIGQVIGHLLPDNAIITDEAATSSLGPAIATATAAPHDHLSLTGGAIGMGLPVATGAAVAAPDRKVVCLHGDGGAMYTVQSLWTQARENLDVTTVIFANHSYAILNVELARVGAIDPGPKALSSLDLHNPEINWTQLGQSMGVNAMRAETTEEFAKCFAACMNEKGPHLIEAII
ncbi:MAG: acetolactate synthase large subunit [Parvibaculaceae bacterium]|nr:acetolactate synthase large subunit [Parvibaculaceae bacterium]